MSQEGYEKTLAEQSQALQQQAKQLEELRLMMEATLEENKALKHKVASLGKEPLKSGEPSADGGETVEPSADAPLKSKEASADEEEKAKPSSLAKPSTAGVQDKVVKEFLEALSLGKETPQEASLRILREVRSQVQAIGEMAAAPRESSSVRVSFPQYSAESREDPDDWAFKLETAFRVNRVNSDEMKLHIAISCLDGVAAAWVSGVQQDPSREVKSLPELLKLMTSLWGRKDLQLHLRECLAALRQTDSLDEYVKQFWGLMLRVKDMAETDKVAMFLKGLQPGLAEHVRQAYTPGMTMDEVVAVANGRVGAVGTYGQVQSTEAHLESRDGAPEQRKWGGSGRRGGWSRFDRGGNRG